MFSSAYQFANIMEERGSAIAESNMPDAEVVLNAILTGPSSSL